VGEIEDAHHAGDDAQTQNDNDEYGRICQQVKQKRQNRIHPALAPIDTGKQIRKT
jgi:hypothetical protein